MIVKNEEAIIERCLRSAAPFIDTWVIVDTGSTDATKEIIKRVAADIGKVGYLEERPWVNFGKNRSEALELCKGRMDWGIMMDADDTLEGTPPDRAVWSREDVDAVIFDIQHGEMRHFRTQGFRISSEWSYKGAVHEWAESKKGATKIERLPPTCWIHARCEGARSKDPEKYLKDARALEEELKEMPNDPRSLFYCAQSFRDAGRPMESAQYYRQRLTAGGWQQEVYISLVNLVNLVPDEREQIDYAWRAIELCPDRLEAPHALLRRRRNEGKPFKQEVFALGAAITNRKPGEHNLFNDIPIYEWRMDDELAICAFWTGHQEIGYSAACAALMRAPVDQRERLRQNAQFSFDKLHPKI
jgi:hypothetical protein